ncbi:MAG: RNA methyltransferase [Rhizobacter sp.]|nr:RNA methyltransferase [Ferruginibacter sp.]
MFSKSTVKYIQSLQHKKFREEEKLFVAEGPKLVTELLEDGIFACRNIYALAGWENSLSKKIEDDHRSCIITIQDFELEKISSLSKPNLVLAVFEQKKVLSSPDLKSKLTLVLDDIQDPGNLGTIIRIADWFGIENIICSLQTADMYNAKVVQSTMASLQRVNVIYTSLEEWLQNQSIKKYATTLNGKAIAHFNQIKEGIIIIGNESKGVSDGVMKLSENKITIPRVGNAESLNAAVATGIILYELRR